MFPGMRRLFDSALAVAPALATSAMQVTSARPAGAACDGACPNGTLDAYVEPEGRGDPGATGEPRPVLLNEAGRYFVPLVPGLSPPPFGFEPPANRVLPFSKVMLEALAVVEPFRARKPSTTSTVPATRSGLRQPRR